MRTISASEAAKLAAASAEQARLDLVRRQQEVAERRARARRQNAIVTTTACLFVLAGILATAFLVVDLTPTPADKIAASPRTPIAPLSADTEAFVASRKAVIRFAESPRNQCRQVEFNNVSGMFSNEVRVSCNDDAPQAVSQVREADTVSRLDSIRGSFAK